jgi:hypothetical protein
MIKKISLLLALTLLVGPLLTLLAGCSQDDKTPPPASSGYYTGPMKSKGAPAGGTGKTGKALTVD